LLLSTGVETTTGVDFGYDEDCTTTTGCAGPSSLRIKYALRLLVSVGGGRRCFSAREQQYMQAQQPNIEMKTNIRIYPIFIRSEQVHVKSSASNLSSSKKKGRFSEYHHRYSMKK
jgi:hypothetical protein